MKRDLEINRKEFGFKIDESKKSEKKDRQNKPR